MSNFKKIILENKFNKNKSQRKILFRSNWEIAFANYIDKIDNITEWKNDVIIKYQDKYIDNKVKKYYVDFFLKSKDGYNYFIEIKPLSSLEKRANTKSMRYKVIHTTNYLKNISKFDKMAQLCDANKNCRFFIVDKSINGFNFHIWDSIKKSPVRINFNF